MSEVKSQTNVKITDGERSKVVHVNRLQHRIQPQSELPLSANAEPQLPWCPPRVEHFILPSAAPVPARRYPLRDRRPPDRLC